MKKENEKNDIEHSEKCLVNQEFWRFFILISNFHFNFFNFKL